MRPKSMILILIALGCGLIASIGISQVVEKGATEEVAEVETSPIYVAIAEVDIGEELTAQRIKLEEWPIDRIPPGAVTTAEQLEEMVPKQRLFAGEPILIGKLADRSRLIGPSERVKPGHRVLSVKVSMDTAVSDLIQPGDRVDILAFVRGRRGTGSKAQTILSNIEVFAVNSVIERQTEDSGLLQAKTVSLQVTPSQAENLVFYREQGRLSLTLRSPDDKSVAEAPIATEPEIEQPIIESTPLLAEKPPEDRTTMQILDGSGNARVFKFNTDGELPEEIVQAGSTPNPSASPIPPFQPPAGLPGSQAGPPPGSQPPVGPPGVSGGAPGSEDGGLSGDAPIDEKRDLNVGAGEIMF